MGSAPGYLCSHSWQFPRQKCPLNLQSPLSLFSVCPTDFAKQFPTMPCQESCCSLQTAQTEFYKQAVCTALETHRHESDLKCEETRSSCDTSQDFLSRSNYTEPWGNLFIFDWIQNWCAPFLFHPICWQRLKLSSQGKRRHMYIKGVQFRHPH